MKEIKKLRKLAELNVYKFRNAEIEVEFFPRLSVNLQETPATVTQNVVDSSVYVKAEDDLPDYVKEIMNGEQFND